VQSHVAFGKDDRASLLLIDSDAHCGREFSHRFPSTFAQVLCSPEPDIIVKTIKDSSLR
jgi:hypothetical protein